MKKVNSFIFGQFFFLMINQIEILETFFSCGYYTLLEK